MYRVFQRFLFVLILVASYPAFYYLFTYYQGWIEQSRRQVILGGRWYNLGIYVPRSEGMFEEIAELESRLGREFRIISLYQGWGPGSHYQFPLQQVEAIASRGALPMITWEPWTIGFYSGDDYEKYELSFFSLRKIADGHFDNYVRSWAREARRWNKTFLLRPGHEMSNPRYPWGPDYGNTPEDFIRFWRYLHQVFREEQVQNVLWVWSPWREKFQAYYPGAEYVDWVGYTALNYGTAAIDGQWMSLKEILEVAYYDLSQYGKPIILSEFGSLASGGDKVRWYQEAFQTLNQHRLIKAVIIFNSDRDQGWVSQTPARDPLDWPLDWKINEFAASLQPYLRVRPEE